MGLFPFKAKLIARKASAAGIVGKFRYVGVTHDGSSIGIITSISVELAVSGSPGEVMPYYFLSEFLSGQACRECGRRKKHASD
jgi:hypothetical protein